jgi:hypothetical protein
MAVRTFENLGHGIAFHSLRNIAVPSPRLASAYPERSDDRARRPDVVLQIVRDGWETWSRSCSSRDLLKVNIRSDAKGDYRNKMTSVRPGQRLASI